MKFFFLFSLFSFLFSLFSFLFSLFSFLFSLEVLAKSARDYSLVPFYKKVINFDVKKAKYSKEKDFESRLIPGKYSWTKEGNTILEAITYGKNSKDSALFILDKSGGLSGLITCDVGCLAVNSDFCREILPTYKDLSGSNTGTLGYLINGLKLDPDQVKKCEDIISKIKKFYEKHGNDLNSLVESNLESINSKFSTNFSNFSNPEFIRNPGVLFERYHTDTQACSRFEESWGSTQTEQNRRSKYKKSTAVQ